MAGLLMDFAGNKFGEVNRNTNEYSFPGNVRVPNGVIVLANQLFNEYFVDGANGNDANSGLNDWGNAVATIQQAMDLITARGAERGRSRVYVAPGGYAEAVTTPTNAIAPFCQLIAANPTPGGSFGATWIQSPTALAPALTILARGWRVSGFEIAAVANTPAILLASDAGGNNAGGTQIDTCLITGWGTAGSIGINAIYNGSPYTKIYNCTFDGLLGDAITCTESGFDNPRWWEIAHNQFRDNLNHIDFVAQGLDEGWIHDNNFMQIGANRTAVLQIALTAGVNNHVGPNNFLSGDYDEGTGGYYAGTNDFWRGNQHEDTNILTSGTGEINPAA